jgi:hypothetical protein
LGAQLQQVQVGEVKHQALGHRGAVAGSPALANSKLVPLSKEERQNTRTVTSFKLSFKNYRKNLVSTTQFRMGDWSQDGDVENNERRTLPERHQRSHWKFNYKY